MENAIRANLNVLMTASGWATGLPPVSGLDIAPLMAAVQSYGEPQVTSTPKLLNHLLEKLLRIFRTLIKILLYIKLRR